jgi:glycosyltransferase involved in cell wall biosynthesis
MELRQSEGTVLVACPDARPPAFQAVIGLHRAGRLRGFLTACYYDPGSRLASLARRLVPGGFSRIERILLRRHDPEIPRAAVQSVPSFDLLHRLEARYGASRPGVTRALARWRTKHFDLQLARTIDRARPQVLFAFSDVGSMAALPLCRRLGIKTIVSMVHGDVREEQGVLARESALSPDFMRIYLGNGALDLELLAWMHERRLCDLALADRVLVPSDHIAETLVRHGTPAGKVRVVPYAADCRRFRPKAGKRHGQECTFLFAGGISHRKGIKYLLEAWRRIRRPGWRLELLGPLPADLGPLEPFLDIIEPLGRVAHAEMPARLSSADVFVFPSLFEGSAVVTYEALACGLPSIVTPNAGSVVRDGIEGFLVPCSEIDSLAQRMEQLGNDPELRARMAQAARARALAFDWPRYHDSLIAAVDELMGDGRAPSRVPANRREGAQFSYFSNSQSDPFCSPVR